MGADFICIDGNLKDTCWADDYRDGFEERYFMLKACSVFMSIIQHGGREVLRHQQVAEGEDALAHLVERVVSPARGN